MKTNRWETKSRGYIEINQRSRQAGLYDQKREQEEVQHSQAGSTSIIGISIVALLSMLASAIAIWH